MDTYFLNDIAVDNAGQAAVVGWSSLATGQGNVTQVVINKLKADGSGYVFSTLDDANGKFGESVAVDTQGNVYATGDAVMTASSSRRRARTSRLPAAAMMLSSRS